MGGTGSGARSRERPPLTDAQRELINSGLRGAYKFYWANNNYELDVVLEALVLIAADYTGTPGVQWGTYLRAALPGRVIDVLRRDTGRHPSSRFSRTSQGMASLEFEFEESLSLGDALPALDDTEAEALDIVHPFDLDGFVEALPSPHRAILKRVLAGDPYIVMANEMGITESRIAQYVQRASHILRLLVAVYDRPPGVLRDPRRCSACGRWMDPQFGGCRPRRRHRSCPDDGRRYASFVTHFEHFLADRAENSSTS